MTTNRKTRWDTVHWERSSDAEIARAFGVTRAAVHHQRKKRGALPSMPSQRREALNGLRLLLDDDGPVLQLVTGRITYSRFCEMVRERVETHGATQSEIRPLMMTKGWTAVMHALESRGGK